MLWKQLLLNKLFDQISTVKLAEKVELGRSSFFIHITKSKYDMIEHYQSKLFHTFWVYFPKHKS